MNTFHDETVYKSISKAYGTSVDEFKRLKIRMNRYGEGIITVCLQKSIKLNFYRYITRVSLINRCPLNL